MIDRVEIEQRLLHRLSGGLPAGELSEWARAALAFASDEGPTLFAPEEAMLLDKTSEARFHAGKAVQELPRGTPGWLQAQDILQAAENEKDK